MRKIINFLRKKPTETQQFEYVDKKFTVEEFRKKNKKINDMFPVAEGVSSQYEDLKRNKCTKTNTLAYQQWLAKLCIANVPR